MPQPEKSQSAKLRSPSVSMHLFTSLCLKDENHQLCEVQSKRDQQFNNNYYNYVFQHTAMRCHDTKRLCNVEKTVICKILGNIFPLTIIKFNSKLPHKENKNFNLDISLYE